MQQAQRDLRQLEKQCEAAKGKDKRELEEKVEKLKKDIKGHEKEGRPKWPKRPLPRR